MIQKIITEESRSLMRSFIGTRFVSWESAYDAAFTRIYGNLRINATNGAFEIYNLESPTGFFDGTEDLSGFTVKNPAGAKFKAYTEEDSISIPVNEIIRDIVITTDEITVNDGEYAISIDMAITIVTDEHSYTFSRGWYFSEMISYSVDTDIDTVYSVNQVTDDWSNDGEDKVSVKRSSASV